MKEQAIFLVKNIEDPAVRLNLLREYLQALVLRSLHESEAFLSIAFVGGTALRFLENLPRFSEDLDFSLADRENYEPKIWFKKVKQDIAHAGFDCSVSWKQKHTVHSAWIGIAGLLSELGLASRAEQKLSIKAEIDSNPPRGAHIERSVITKHLTFATSHYSLDSLFAGKLHALLTRSYNKGRDWYDLLWFASRRPVIHPHLQYLQNALDQSQGKGKLEAKNWKNRLRRDLKTIDIQALAQDVNPFLQNPSDRDLLTRENLLSVL